MNTSISIERSDASMIACGLNIDASYVRKVLNGDRDTKSRMAKKILKAKEILSSSRTKIQKLNDEE